MTSQFFGMTSLLISFKVVVFPLSSLATGPSFMSMSGSGVLTIFIYKGLTRNPEIGNTPSAFYPNWDELGIPNLARMSLIECCKMSGL